MSNPQTTPARRLKAAERRVRVLELTQQGFNVREVGAQLGVSHGTAWNDLQAALKEYAARQTVETATLRALETARLDELQSSVYSKALSGNVDAVECVLAIMARRAKLLGLDQPIKVDLSAEVEFHVEQILEQIERVLPREHFRKVVETLAAAA